MAANSRQVATYQLGQKRAEEDAQHVLTKKGKAAAAAAAAAAKSSSDDDDDSQLDVEE